MSLRLRLLLVIAFVAVVPVAFSAWTSLSIHEEAFDDQARDLRAKSARFGAELAQLQADGALDTLDGLARRGLLWTQLSDEERDGALWLLYSQLEELSLVALVDHQDALVSPPAFLDEGMATGEWKGHPELAAAEVEAFAASPLPGTGDAKSAFIGPAVELGGELQVPLVYPIPGAATDRPWKLVATLSLRKLCKKLSHASPEDAELFLLDQEGRELCGRTAPALPSSSTLPAEIELTDADGRTLLSAATENELGWTALVTQPAELAQVARNSMRNRSLFWLAIGVVAAAAAGLVLAGGIAKPIKELESAAKDIESGNYDQELPVESGDEIAALASAFNAMSAEIKRWDRELNQRVEDRTKELKEAQGQLIEARKMAAVASLSAGVAHEINNPLAGVLTLTQILLRKAKQGKSVKDPVSVLSSIETEAQRIADIVAQMRTLERSGKEGFMDQDLGELLEGIAERFGEQARDAGVEIVVERGEAPQRVFANLAQLNEAISNIVDNGIKAMSEAPGPLTLRLRDLDDELLVLEVEDRGRGIPEDVIPRIFDPFFTTKEHWRGTGLGLSVAHQIIGSHNGLIKVESIVGEGSCFKITLPKASQRSHLV